MIVMSGLLKGLFLLAAELVLETGMSWWEACLRICLVEKSCRYFGLLVSFASWLVCSANNSESWFVSGLACSLGPASGGRLYHCFNKA